MKTNTLNLIRCLLIIMICVAGTNSFGQLKVLNDGKVGVGSATTPTSQLELGSGQYIKLNGTAGLLFRETGNQLPTDIQWGGKVYFDGANDVLLLVTKNNVSSDNLGISIQRTYGRVGIGMLNPSYTLDVNGYVRATNVSVSSDIRLKDDIKDFEPKIQLKLLDLKAKTFRPLLIEPTSFVSKPDSITGKDRSDDPKNKTMFGFIAQDVKKIFPELVNEDDNGYLSLDYMGLIPVLVEAYKELYQSNSNNIEEIKYLNQSLADLKVQITNCCDPKTKSTSEKESYNNFTPVLNQNAPNPFNSKTTISYFIPKEVKSANLYFYNLEGKQLRSIPIDTRENGTTVFDGGEFVPGMYYYTLILDGNEIDTKKMIITD